MEKSDIRPTVRLKPNSYQPGGAELGEPVIIRGKDGSIPSTAEPARVALAAHGHHGRW